LKKNRGGLFSKKTVERYFEFRCAEKELTYAKTAGGKTKTIPLSNVKAEEGSTDDKKKQILY